MSRKPKDDVAEPKVSQDVPTALPPRDEQGFELDSWGLPIVGPVRAARLAALGKPDPNIDPDAWEADAVQLPTGGSASNEELNNG